MPFQIINEDIREIFVDAIVNSTNEYLIAAGGTDKLIHEVAGPKLDEACLRIGGISMSEAVMTPSFDMYNCEYIIHTAGPVYIDGKHQEKEYLKKCYENCLKLAKENDIESLAFPLISSGTYHFPKGEAVSIATKVIVDFLEKEDMDIYLLLYDKNELDRNKKVFKEIDGLLQPEPAYAQKYEIPSIAKKRKLSFQNILGESSSVINVEEKHEEVHFDCAPSMAEPVLSDADIFKTDVKFGDYLTSIIDSKNYKDTDVYKRSNISKSVFNDIKNGRHKPKKETLCALCFGLRLNLDESLELLDRAGFTLSNYLTFDRIIRHFLEKKNYNIFDINEVLFEYDCTLLGSKSF